MLWKWHTGNAFPRYYRKVCRRGVEVWRVWRWHLPLVCPGRISCSLAFLVRRCNWVPFSSKKCGSSNIALSFLFELFLSEKPARYRKVCKRGIDVWRVWRYDVFLMLSIVVTKGPPKLFVMHWESLRIDDVPINDRVIAVLGALPLILKQEKRVRYCVVFIGSFLVRYRVVFGRALEVTYRRCVSSVLQKSV